MKLYMNVYLGQTRARGWINTLESYGFGEMVCRGELPPRRHPWAYDNGAFKDWTAGAAFNEKRYLADLDCLHLVCTTRPDFLIPPDRVGGGLDSLKFSLSWVERCKPYGPLYLAVQDGMTEADVDAVLEPFAGVFVGGTHPWKLRTARAWADFAHARGRKLHIGRVGTEKKVRWALRIGADSVDSCLPLWSAENLARFLKGFMPEVNCELPGMPQ